MASSTRTRSNAILVCHALTGDQYVAETHPLTGKPGWWDMVVGPGLPIDTERFFVICANVLGGCMGSTGPRSPRDDTDRPDAPRWGTDFPPVTIRDMVRAQKRLIDHLGIARLFAVIGGSMGGMQVLEWAASYPDAVFAAIPIATAANHSAQNIAFNEVGRQAIFADPDWLGGQLLGARAGAGARAGGRAHDRAHHLSVRAGADAEVRPPPARRAAGRRCSTTRSRWRATCATRAAASCVASTPTSYLTITRAMDYFDLAADHGGDLSAPFRGTRTRFCVISFSSDWLFPTAESRTIARALNRAAANVSFVEIATDKGHDAFLLDEPDFHRTLAGFLAGCAEHAGLPA